MTARRSSISRSTSGVDGARARPVIVVLLVEGAADQSPPGRAPVPATSRAIWVPSADDTRSSVVVISFPSFTTAGASRLALMGRSGDRRLDIARERATACGRPGRMAASRSELTTRQCDSHWTEERCRYLPSRRPGTRAGITPNPALDLVARRALPVTSPGPAAGVDAEAKIKGHADGAVSAVEQALQPVLEDRVEVEVERFPDDVAEPGMTGESACCRRPRSWWRIHSSADIPVSFSACASASRASAMPAHGRTG